MAPLFAFVLLHTASAKSLKLCWILLTGALFTIGVPEFRDSIIILWSLGTSQKKGLPKSSTAFSLLMSVTIPTRLSTNLTLGPSLPSASKVESRRIVLRMLVISN